MFPQDEFKKYAIKHKGISSLNLHRFQTATNSYITPNIIEERQLNIATMDVFSRLMMDRIIFLGVHHRRRCGNYHYGPVVVFGNCRSGA